MNEFVFSTDEHTGERIDKFLSEKEINVSRSGIAKLIDEGGVSVGGKTVKKNYKLRTGDEIFVSVPDPVILEAVPQNIPIEIVYEDDCLLVVNKPKGMVVHPAPGNPDGTLVNALMYHCDGRLSSINGVVRPGIVHRIDKNTSGLLMVAKTDYAHNFLAEQIKEHTFTREYRAIITNGRVVPEIGTVSAPIGRSKTDRKKMCVTCTNSKNAVTHYEILEEFGEYSLAKFTLETGRTHQIRVHCAYMGHPVLGDEVYGRAYKGIEGQCLHAKKIGFIHPETKKYMEFDSVLPEYFMNLLEKLKKSY